MTLLPLRCQSFVAYAVQADGLHAPEPAGGYVTSASSEAVEHRRRRPRRLTNRTSSR